MTTRAPWTLAALLALASLTAASATEPTPDLSGPQALAQAVAQALGLQLAEAAGGTAAGSFDTSQERTGRGLVGLVVGPPEGQPVAPGRGTDFQTEVVRFPQLTVVRYSFQNPVHASRFVEHQLIAQAPFLAEQRGATLVVMSGDLVRDATQTQRARVAIWGEGGQAERLGLGLAGAHAMATTVPGDLFQALDGVLTKGRTLVEQSPDKVTVAQSQGGAFEGKIESYRFSGGALVEHHTGETARAAFNVTQEGSAGEVRARLVALFARPAAPASADSQSEGESGQDGAAQPTSRPTRGISERVTGSAE